MNTLTSPTDAAHTPEFSRPQAVAGLGHGAPEISERATGEERAALARRYGVQSVKRLTVTARIKPWDAGWRVEGVARARITQSCVVTLEPVDQMIEETFRQAFLPGVEAPDDMSLDIDPDADDPALPLGDTIDLGALAAEVVALAIDPYPRLTDADFAGASATPERASQTALAPEKPFAGLAALRDRLNADED